MKNTPSSQSDTVAQAPERKLGYPLHDYIASWKIFRSFSNEDETIASHVISRLYEISGPTDLTRKRSLSIVDIGPGDGRVLIEFLLRLPSVPASLAVVEPNSVFMEETARCVSHYKFAASSRYFPTKLAEVPLGVLDTADVILATHCVYFLDDAEMARLFEELRPGARLCIVMDTADSLFARIWKQTAPAFSERAAKHRARLQALDSSQFKVRQSTFDTRVKSPFEIRDDLGEMLMNLICYKDVRDFTDEEWAPIRAQIERSVMDGYITCQSVCFDIQKT